jgi:hypothetical protein
MPRNGLLNDYEMPAIPPSDNALLRWNGDEEWIEGCLGLSSSGTPGQTVFIQDATPTTGVTTLYIKAGPGQDVNALLYILQAAGNAVVAISNIGHLNFSHDLMVRWSDTNGNVSATKVLAIGANGTETLEINSVTPGDLRDFAIRKLKVGGYTSSFPQLRNNGTTLEVRDGTDAVYMPLKASLLTSLVGGSTSAMTNVGVANVQTSSAGVGNAADTSDDTLFTYSLPSNAMASNGNSVRVRASGTTAANGNNKRVKLWFAGTAIVDSQVITANAKNWMIEMEITRLDSTHVSAIGSFTVDGAASVLGFQSNLAVSDLTANASIIKSTGASPTTGAANDVKGYLQKTWFEN